MRMFAIPLIVLLAACGNGQTKALRIDAPGRPVCVYTSNLENSLGAAVTSKVRGDMRLPPVRPNTLLARVAAEHSCDMAARGMMTHEGTYTSGPGERVKLKGYRPAVTAENIAAGPWNLEQVLNQWNKSSGHMGNILIPAITEFGIGRAVSPDGKTTYWTAVYARPRQALGKAF